MRQSLLILLCATLTSGCGGGDPASALALEKRLQSGDTTAITELEGQAHSNPWAALALGRAYQLGLGTEIDLAAAMQNYSLAQKIPGAWFNAGLVYSQYLIEGLPSGASGEPDNACFQPSAKSPARRAVDCLSHAAESASPIQARIALGKLYRDGHQDLAPNPSKACLWFSKAAEEHDDEGRFQYAMCLIKGEGVSQNIKTGTHLLLQAAKGYHVDAIRELARLFRDSQDKSKAAFWMLLLSKIDQSSRSEAVQFLVSLSREERTQAKAQLDAWLLAHNAPTQIGSRFSAHLPVSVADLQQ